MSFRTPEPMSDAYADITNRCWRMTGHLATVSPGHRGARTDSVARTPPSPSLRARPRMPTNRCDPVCGVTASLAATSAPLPHASV
jgi:hypothetical protein